MKEEEAEGTCQATDATEDPCTGPAERTKQDSSNCQAGKACADSRVCTVHAQWHLYSSCHENNESANSQQVDIHFRMRSGSEAILSRVKMRFF